MLVFKFQSIKSFRFNKTGDWQKVTAQVWFNTYIHPTRSQDGTSGKNIANNHDLSVRVTGNITL